MHNAAWAVGATLLSGCDRTISELTKAMGQSVPSTLALPTGAEIDPDFHLL